MKPKIILVLFLVVLTPKAIAQNSEFERLIQKGIEFHDNRDYPNAINAYQQALRLEPNSLLAFYEIAFSYFEMKDYKNALKYSKKVIKANKDHMLHGYMIYGSSLDMLGKVKESIKAFEKAGKEFDHYLIYYNLAVTCMNAGYTDKAFDAVIKAISNRPQHPGSHLLLSQVAAAKQQKTQSALALYYFLMLEPGSARAKAEYPKLIRYLNDGVERKDEKNITLYLSALTNDPFGTVETSLSLFKATFMLEGKPKVSDNDRYQQLTARLFASALDFKNENKGIFWDFYVPFFGTLEKEKMTEAFFYHISLSQGDEVVLWIKQNEDAYTKMINWVNLQF
jgi:tetratricopeptide (TPR) repeat protein